MRDKPICGVGTIVTFDPYNYGDTGRSTKIKNLTPGNKYTVQAANSTSIAVGNDKNVLSTYAYYHFTELREKGINGFRPKDSLFESDFMEQLSKI